MHFESICDSECRQEPCHITYTKSNMVVTVHDIAQFIVKIPPEPFTKVTCHPSIRLIEFLVYILSCFGTWFGISVLGLNPLKFISAKSQDKTSDLKSPPVDINCYAFRIHKAEIEISELMRLLSVPRSSRMSPKNSNLDKRAPVSHLFPFYDKLC